jgi:chemotaxis protein histidine kinase CheA
MREKGKICEYIFFLIKKTKKSENISNEKKNNEIEKQEKNDNNENNDKAVNEKTETKESQTIAEKAVEKLAAIENPAKEILTAVAEKITGKKETVKDSKNEINLQNNQKQTKEIDSRVEQVRVQPESQQVLKNVKTDSIAQATKTAPTIQVNSDVNIEAIKSSKNPVKEALDQPSLSQEVLDKTNARVVSIETQANSDNLLNRQNAQEQSVKLSIVGLCF